MKLDMALRSMYLDAMNKRVSNKKHVRVQPARSLTPVSLAVRVAIAKERAQKRAELLREEQAQLEARRPVGKKGRCRGAWKRVKDFFSRRS